MPWWGYALLAAACWGLQYVLLEVLFERIDFATALTFLTLASGLLLASVLFVLSPRQDWTQLWRSWPVMGMIAVYLLCGCSANLFTAFAIRDRNATVASLLEITYPVFIILFTALILRRIHLEAKGFLGALLILAGCALVLWDRAK